MLEVLGALFDLFAILRVAVLGNQIIQQEGQLQSHKGFKHASPSGKQALVVISQAHIGIQRFSIAYGISEFQGVRNPVKFKNTISIKGPGKVNVRILKPTHSHQSNHLNGHHEGHKFLADFLVVHVHAHEEENSCQSA